jgi:hypothetical protein
MAKSAGAKLGGQLPVVDCQLSARRPGHADLAMLLKSKNKNLDQPTVSFEASQRRIP